MRISGSTWDVVIVGAGPAGSSLALMLARQNHSVLLLDRAVFPRDKFCGEFIGPGARRILEQIGVSCRGGALGTPVPGMSVHSPNGTVFQANFPPGETGLAIRRREFDDVLLCHARRSAECLQGFRVERLVYENGRATGVAGRRRDGNEQTFRARLIVGADGRNSLVARALGLFRWHPTRRKAVLGVHYRETATAGGRPEVHLARSCYGILNPLGDGAVNVNLVVGEEEIRRAKGNLDACFFGLLEKFPGIAKRLEGAAPVERVKALGPLAHRTSRASADGVLLVGDAAGFYDPFTGEGVYMAMRSAQLAAEAIHAALESGDYSRRNLARYDAARAGELNGRYRFETLVQAIVNRPFLADFVAGQLKRKQRAAGSLMEVIGGLVPPRELLSPAFLGGLAWR